MKMMGGVGKRPIGRKSFARGYVETVWPVARLTTRPKVGSVAAIGDSGPPYVL